MTTKERTLLKAKASKIQPIFQIGKLGINAALVEEVKAALQARELIKISVLRGADFDAKDAVDELAKLTGSETVQTIGNKIVLYKLSTKEGIKHILEE